MEITFHVSLGSGDDSSSFHYPKLITLGIVVFWAMSDYCPLCPSPQFSCGITTADAEGKGEIFT